MIKLVQYVSHPELCAEIVKQFAFMKAMARPDDNNFAKLQELSLDDIFNKADIFFVEFTSFEEMIDVFEINLTSKIESFLQQWQSITDIAVIQQNIHYELNQLDIDNDFSDLK